MQGALHRGQFSIHLSFSWVEDWLVEDWKEDKLEHIQTCPRCVEEGIGAALMMRPDEVYKCACGTAYILYRSGDEFILKAVK